MQMLLNSQWMMDHLATILASITGLLAVALVAFLIMNLQLAKLRGQYRTMMRGMEGANLEALLLGQVEQVRSVQKKVELLTEDCQRLAAQTQLCVQRVGMVRYNAFDDTGSDLSFSAALLDANNNGLVVSSIYGRADARVYAKPISNGESSYFLSDEERAALQKAQENNR